MPANTPPNLTSPLSTSGIIDVRRQSAFGQEVVVRQPQIVIQHLCSLFDALKVVDSVRLLRFNHTLLRFNVSYAQSF